MYVHNNYDQPIWCPQRGTVYLYLMNNHKIEQPREASIEWMNVLADKVNKLEVMSMADKVHGVHSNFVAITAAME